MKLKYLAIMILANFLWASSDIAAKYALDTVTPLTLSWLRISIAALAVTLLFGRELWTTICKAPWIFAAAGLTGYSLNFIFFNGGLYFSSAAHGAAIRPTEVLLVALLARLLLKENVGYRAYVSGAMGAAGVYWIVASGASNAAGGNVVLGDLLMVAATLFDALYSIVCKFTAKAADALRAVAAAIAVGFVASSLFLAVPSVQEFVAKPPSWQVLLVGIYLGLFVTVIAYWLYARILEKVDAHIAASTILLQPVFGVILAVLLLDEKITGSFLAGAAVVTVSVGILIFPSRRQAPKPVPGTAEAAG